MFSEYILKSQAMEDIASGNGFVHTDHEECFKYVAGRDLVLYHENDVTWSNEMDEYVHDDDIVTSYGGDNATEEWFMESDYYVKVRYGEANGNFLSSDIAIYCEDIGDYVHENDAHYCDSSDEYYYDVDEMPNNTDTTILHNYHEGPPSIDISSGAKFRIGFEIEKNEVNNVTDEVGEFVGEYDLIARFETDSSCGYDDDTGVEAITHILPLSGVRSKRRKDLFELIDQASGVINSNSDSSCGGHLTISVTGYSSVNLLEKLRGNMGILYSLYRRRLKNSYCDRNKEMKPNHHGGSCVAQLKGCGLVEFRLPSRVVSVKQLKLRYDLMYVLVRRSLDGTPYSKIIKEVKPIITKMYDNNKNKVNEIIGLSNHFRKYLISDHVSEEIREFIDGTNNND